MRKFDTLSATHDRRAFGGSAMGLHDLGRTPCSKHLELLPVGLSSVEGRRHRRCCLGELDQSHLRRPIGEAKFAAVHRRPCAVREIVEFRIRVYDSELRCQRGDGDRCLFERGFGRAGAQTARARPHPRSVHPADVAVPKEEGRYPNPAGPRRRPDWRAYRPMGAD
jgi:hypothetical protein